MSLAPRKGKRLLEQALRRLAAWAARPPPSPSAHQSEWAGWVFGRVVPVLSRIDEPFAALVESHKREAIRLDDNTVLCARLVSLPFILASAEAVIETSAKARRAATKALLPVRRDARLWLLREKPGGDAAYFGPSFDEDAVRMQYEVEREWRRRKMLGPRQSGTKKLQRKARRR